MGMKEDVIIFIVSSTSGVLRTRQTVRAWSMYVRREDTDMEIEREMKSQNGAKTRIVECVFV